MATFPYLFTAAFGAPFTGLGASLNLTVKDAAGGTHAFVPTWAEELDAAGNATTGVYDTTLTFDTTWTFPLRARVTITGQAGVVATEIIDPVQVVTGGGGSLTIPIVKHTALLPVSGFGAALAISPAQGVRVSRKCYLNYIDDNALTQTIHCIPEQDTFTTITEILSTSEGLPVTLLYTS